MAHLGVPGRGHYERLPDRHQPSIDRTLAHHAPAHRLVTESYTDRHAPVIRAGGRREPGWQACPRRAGTALPYVMRSETAVRPSERTPATSWSAFALVRSPLVAPAKTCT